MATNKQIVTEEDVESYLTELQRLGELDIHQAIYGEEVDDDVVRNSTKPTTRAEGTL
jgi:hypothetical protein